MKKQLTAKNPLMNMTIIQRYIDGVRYYKIMPKSISALAINNIKKSFEGKPIKVEDGTDGWVKITKTGKDTQFEEKAKENLELQGKTEDDVDEEMILNKEAEILKKQGFIVTIEDLE